MTGREKSPPSSAKPSPWEWLPVAALLVLAAAYWHAGPEGMAGRFAFWVGFGLLPGVLWRLAGRSSWNVHRAGFAAGLVAFVLDNPSLRPDAHTWEKILLHWPLVLAGAAVSFTQPLWGMLRSRRLLVDSGVDISLNETLKLILIGSFFNVFLPGSTGGDAYRVYAISRGFQTRLGPAIASVSLDRLLGLPALILVVVLGMLLDYRFLMANRILSRLIPFIAVSGAFCLALVAYLVWAGKRHRLSSPSTSGASAAGIAGRCRSIHQMIATNVKHPGTLPLALLYGFMSHCACILSCLFFGLALGVQGVPPLRYVLIVPMAMTINSIPFAPGGVGQGELAMATLLDLASPGVGNAQEGVMIMLLFRLSNLAIGLAGGLYYALGKRGGGARPEASMTEIAESHEAAQRESRRVFARTEEGAGGGSGSWR